MKKLSRQQWLFVGIALICFAMLKAGLIYWYLQNKGSELQRQDVSCSNLQQGCTLPDGSVLRFDRTPHHSQPFLITLGKTAGAAPAAEFSMEKMDMGFNRYRFVDGNTQWQAKVTLPVCISGSGDWLLDLKYADRSYRIRFKSQ